MASQSASLFIVMTIGVLYVLTLMLYMLVADSPTVVVLSFDWNTALYFSTNLEMSGTSLKMKMTPDGMV